MRFLLYSLGVQCYYALIWLAQLFSPKARQYIHGRNTQLTGIKARINKWAGSDIIWVHAASYGEFEMARPIVKALENRDPSLKFVISFHSPSGYEQIDFDNNKFLKIYLPFDSVRNQIKYLKLIQPRAVLIIKYEFWFNFLRALNKLSIPYYFTSLHINSESYLFKWWMRPFEKLIRNATKIFVHNTLSQKILKARGYNNTLLFGDTRIDQVLHNKVQGIHINWAVSRPCIAFGSILRSEEQFVCDFINSNSDYNYIIAPHDIDELTIERMGQNLEMGHAHYSSIKQTLNVSDQVVLVDTMGDLRYLYSSADACYIGGGFDKGPHNVLEPLIFGNMVMCGPNILKFPMAQLLSSVDLLKVIDNQRDMGSYLIKLFNVDKLEHQRKVQNFIEQNKTNLEALIQELFQDE